MNANVKVARETRLVGGRKYRPTARVLPFETVAAETVAALETVAAPKAQDYWLKRPADACLAAFLLVLTLPVLFGIWLVVVITSEGPGLYWSRRVGRQGSIFWMPKFRTMEFDCPQAPRETLETAAGHITPFGTFLRRSSLDELPQLFSILKGDMSFIGPRPLMPEDAAVAARKHFPLASAVRPGLSGLAQVSGRNRVSPRRKARLDALYARSVSPALDAQIFARTALIVVTGQGFM